MKVVSYREIREAPYRNTEEIIRESQSAGYHFFDADSMRYFGSKVVSGPAIGGRFFITSEQDNGEPRLYTVREAMPDGSIETIGEFQQYKTLGSARTAARKAAEDAFHLYYVHFDGEKESRQITAPNPWAAIKLAKGRRRNVTLRWIGRA